MNVLLSRRDSDREGNEMENGDKELCAQVSLALGSSLNKLKDKLIPVMRAVCRVCDTSVTCLVLSYKKNALRNLFFGTDLLFLLEKLGKFGGIFFWLYCTRPPEC